MAKKTAKKTPAAAAPKPLPKVTLLLSEIDRWFAAQALFTSPWGGGEAIIVGLSTIHETLKLSKVPLNKKPPELSKSASAYTFVLPHADLLIQVLCGQQGVGFPGSYGPALAKLVIRLRAQVKKATPAPAPPPSAEKGK